MTGHSGIVCGTPERPIPRGLRKARRFLARPHLPRRLDRLLRSRFPLIHRALKYRTLDPTSKKYWDGVWTDEGRDTWRTYPNLFRKVSGCVPPGSRVLDIGCGPGILLDLLRKHRQCTGVGLDLSTVAARLVDELAISAVVAKLPEVPFKDYSFDVAIGTEVLEHLHDPAAALREMKRVTKSRGLVICSVPNACMGPDDCDEHLHEFDLPTFVRLIDDLGHAEIANVEDMGGPRLLATITTT